MSHSNTLVSLDLAKSSIQVAVEDLSQRKIIKNQAMSVHKAKAFLAKHKPCTVAMEACATSHHWSWLAESHGHNVILLPPAHVAAYRQGHKTDATDVEAINEAGGRDVVGAAAHGWA